MSGKAGTLSWGNLSGETNYTWPRNGWTLNGNIGLPAGNYTINGNLVVPNGTVLGIHPLDDNGEGNGIGVVINVIGNATIEPTGIVDGVSEGFIYYNGSGGGASGLNQGGTHGGRVQIIQMHHMVMKLNQLV